MPEGGGDDTVEMDLIVEQKDPSIKVELTALHGRIISASQHFQISVDSHRLRFDTPFEIDEPQLDCEIRWWVIAGSVISATRLCLQWV